VSSNLTASAKESNGTRTEHSSAGFVFQADLPPVLPDFLANVKNRSGDTMTIDWGKVFDKFGVKRVTSTDKNKSAYVPNVGQRAAIEAAGVIPATVRPAPEFDVTVLSDINFKSVKASYYYSERLSDPSRSPEPRMGHEIVSTWLNIGDEVVIGNIGTQVFAVKVLSSLITEVDVAKEVVKRADKQAIFARAKEATGKPASRESTRSDFVRNPYVVAAAVLRASGRCEMPRCSTTLFEREDGTLYLEVHHVVPLGEEGDDTLANAAAICPHCHRELHFGKERMTRRRELAKHIATLSIP
jgi:5-methylcytosine-specific restriction endonuclease McrA